MFSTTDLRLLPRKCSLKLLSSLNLISHTSHTNLQRRTHFHKNMKSKSMCCESISCSWKRTDWILFHQVTHQTKHQHECENHFPVEFPLKAWDATILFINIWGIPQQGIGLPWLRGLQIMLMICTNKLCQFGAIRNVSECKREVWCWECERERSMGVAV